MSVTDNQPNPENNDDQLGTVKHPLRIFLTAIFGFLIPIGALILVLEYATNEFRQGSTTRKLDHEAVVERIQPVAHVAFEPTEEDAELKTGEEVYKMTCATCHADGVAGAPKYGDEGEWAPYIETGYETLLEVALHGKGAMPAKGGNTSLDDLEVERAMVYMANAGGASFPEPGEEGDASAEAPADESEATEVAAADEAGTAPAETDEANDSSAADEADEADEAGDTAASDEESTEVAAADGDEFAATDEQLEIGEQLYKASCFACHDAAVAGAPKFGSAEAWQPYIDTGLDAMLQVAIEGKGAMPPRGASTASDEELKAAILYMVAETK